MKKILLVCAAGMSTSMLVKRMIDHANAISLEVNISALAIAEAKGKIKNNEVDVVLLGPQVRFQKPEIEAVIGAFFIVYTPYQMIDGQAFLTTKYLGAQGLFVAVIVALITSEIFCRLARNPKITITMPAAVPPAVARSFKVLLPIFFVMVFFSALNYCLTLISPAGLNDLIYTLIQTPLKHMGTNIFAVIILGLWVISCGCWGSTDLIPHRQFEKPFFLRLIWRISPGPLNMALPGARHIRLPGLLLMMHSPTAAVQV